MQRERGGTGRANNGNPSLDCLLCRISGQNPIIAVEISNLWRGEGNVKNFYQIKLQIKNISKNTQIILKITPKATSTHLCFFSHRRSSERMNFVVYSLLNAKYISFVTASLDKVSYEKPVQSSICGAFVRGRKERERKRERTSNKTEERALSPVSSIEGDSRKRRPT